MESVYGFFLFFKGVCKNVKRNVKGCERDGIDVWSHLGM